MPILDRERVRVMDFGRTPSGAREALLAAIAAIPGACALEGWSDADAWKTFLPWPGETRSLDWSDAREWPELVASLEAPSQAPATRDEIPFLGGWVGFIGYEAAATLEDARARDDDPPEPPAWFVRHDAGCVLAPGGELLLFCPPQDEERARGRLAAILDARAPEDSPHEHLGESEIESSLDDAAFRAGVESIREAISRGDVYQVNLTRRERVASAADPVALYSAMTFPEPPRCAALLRGPDWTIASASPEVLLSFDRRSGIAESRPIKGTVRRSGDDSRDTGVLLASRKDEAEHLMIVDLVRNDLGKVAAAGDVTVPAYRTIRVLPYVLHLESTVRATGLRDRRTAAILEALMPAGSITGAPKRAAVAAIRELEPVARGVYTGAIGFLDDRGRSAFSVAIRTAVVTPRVTRYHAGGGIVWDSDPDAELAECTAKSVAFLDFFRKGKA